jgi:hypothetical protein
MRKSNVLHPLNLASPPYALLPPLQLDLGDEILHLMKNQTLLLLIAPLPANAFILTHVQHLEVLIMALASNPNGHQFRLQLLPEMLAMTPTIPGPLTSPWAKVSQRPLQPKLTTLASGVRCRYIDAAYVCSMGMTADTLHTAAAQVYSKLRSTFSTGRGYGSQLEDCVTVALFPILFTSRIRTPNLKLVSHAYMTTFSDLCRTSYSPTNPLLRQSLAP